MRHKVLDQQGLHFLTATIVDWIDIFTRPVYKDMLIDSLRFCCEHKGLHLHAYVIMSNHIHLIARVGDKKGLSRVLQSFKSYTAKQIMDYLKDKKQPESRREWLLRQMAFNARISSSQADFQIWQKNSSFPVLLYSPRKIRQKLHYIHQNPVKAKIVAQPEHYLYSSASNYVDGTGVLEVEIMDWIWNDIEYMD